MTATDLSTARRPARRARRSRGRPGPLAAYAAASVALALGYVLVARGGHVSWPAPRLHPPRLELLAAAPAVIRLHVAAAFTAFAVGCVLLAGVKGTALHKALGWTWVAAMMATAVGSFFIRVIHPGHWSFIHFLSGWVAIAVPMGVVAIRRKNVRLHRRLMTGQFIGGLVIAGAFTFTPGRLMWNVFFG